LYSNGEYLDKLPDLKKKIEDIEVTTAEGKSIIDQITRDFKNNPRY
jgi:hypothetical protein